MSSVLSNVRFDRTQTRVSIRDEMPSDGPDVSIVMPCLNEAETLGACIDAALEALRQSGLSGEVVIADNGSTDGSQAIALGRGVRVVEVAAKGYGNALRGGIEAARGEHVVLGDADYSYDFLDVPRFVAKLREGYDLVMGNRFKGEILPGAMPWKHRYIGNPVLSGIGRLLFRAPVGDFHCGIRGLSRAAYSDLRLRTTGMEFASEMVIKSALVGLRIAEIPVQLRPDGRSRPPHLRSWRDGWRHLRFMLLLSPSILFLVPGGMLSVLGLLTFATVWSTVVPVNAVAESCAMVLAGLAMLVGTQLCIFGQQACGLTRDFQIRRSPDDIGGDSMNRGEFLSLVFGTVIAVVGCGMIAWSTLSSFGGHESTSDSQTYIRTFIPSATLIAWGTLLAFGTFFAGFLRIVADRTKVSRSGNTRSTSAS